MLEQSSSAVADRPQRGRVAGIAIVVSAALTIAAIAHHPTITTARGPAHVLSQVAALSVADETVHGLLIAMVAALLFGLTAFSLRRGLGRETVLAGLIVYAVAAAALIGAALIDGFLVPTLAARYVGATPQSVDMTLHVLAACSAAIQILTKLGLGATSLALTLWAVDLVRSRGTLRVAGAIGFASGPLSLVLLVFSGNLNPHNLGAIVLLQSIWYFAVGTLLIRNDV